MSKWVKCSERLPTKDTIYLLFVPLGNGWYQTVAMLRPITKEWHELWFGKIVEGVTHWRPLPKPPKG